MMLENLSILGDFEMINAVKKTGNAMKIAFALGLFAF